MYPKLKEGAVLIADSHYSPKNPHFLEFLQKVASGAIKTSQLIFLGDNFDLLIPRIKKTVHNNLDAIKLIQKISETKEVIYFEGNHDFLLQKIFPKVKIFSFFHQPQIFECQGKTLLISHGDKSNNLKHTLTTNLFRNSVVVNFLDIFTLNFLNNRYIDTLVDKLLNKKICSEIENFEAITHKRILKIRQNVDYIIEGHFHQGKTMTIRNSKYINVDSFACNQSYLVVQCSQNSISFTKKTL